MDTQLRILILEDNASDAELVQRELRKSGLDFTAQVTPDKGTYLQALDAFAPDLILADYSLPGFDGLTALSLARQRLGDVPAVIVSGAIGEETAIEALKAGATDYVLKQRLSRLAPVVKRALLEAKQLAEKRQAEEALARERANLRAVFDVVNVGMLVIAEDGAVKQVNDTLSRWVRKDVLAWEGGQPGDFVGCVHALADPAGCGHSPHCASCPIRNTFASVLQTGQPIHDVEAEAILLVDGSKVPLWLEVSADPLVLDGKRHVILAMNNITARKQVEETLQRTTEELARSNKELQQFASVASHDLQEPLRTVSGFVQLLQKKYESQLDAEAKTFIEYAVDGTKRMETLIRDLLVYARVGTRGREPSPTDASAALRQALGNLHQSIQEARAEITQGELPTVRADPSQLAQLFQNLIGNAMKFRSEAPPKIHVDARRDGDCWQFSVSDNGIGIDAKFQEHIFEIFRRLHTQKQYAGTGIGLAICKKIVDGYGGRIWMESEPGQGVTFYFTFPI